MGALTDTHKRYFVDIFSPLFSSPSPSHKKPRTSSPPAPLPVAPDTRAPPKQPHPPRFPPAAPLRRPVQGPQRIIRVFGLGLGNPKPSVAADPHAVWRFGGWKMGNWMTRVESGAKRKAPSGDGGGSGATGLRLDEYKRLVEGLQEERGPVEEASEDVINAGEASPSKAIVAEEYEKLAEEEEVRVSDGKEEEPMEMVKLEVTPVREDDAGWSRRTTPLYKELLEETSRKHDGRLRSLDFEVKLAEKKVSALRIVSEEKPKEEKDGPFAPLTEEDENDVSLALRDPKRFSQLRDVLVMHEESNIEITREIIQCLRHASWLNDEVINLYFELLKEREKRNPKKFLKCHFFNTFFYKKLTSGRGGFDFKAVRRWTTQRKIGYGLIECDKVFVPIHKDIHWCLAVINTKDKKFQYLDSLGKMDRGVLNVLARYLVEEVKDKSNKVIDVKSWKQEFVENLPLQKNGWDCGVFMIKYADFFSRGLALSFGQEHMEYFRKRTAKEILRLKAD